jgi:hypothetical protein
VQSLIPLLLCTYGQNFYHCLEIIIGDLFMHTDRTFSEKKLRDRADKALNLNSLI